MTEYEMEQRIAELTRSLHPELSEKDEDNLITSGLFDSLDFEELFYRIEGIIGSEIPAEAYTIENCSSVKSLAALALRCRAHDRQNHSD